MYAAAQRVASRSREGINTFLSLHPETSVADIDWHAPPIEELAERRPGILLFEDCDLRPGGNHVRSFLDIVTANAKPLAEIVSALDTLAPAAAASSTAPFIGSVGGVTIRFDVDDLLQSERADEYGLLVRRIARLLEASLTTPRATAAE